MGCIYKRGKTYWIKYYRNGKPFRESTRSHKEADAKKLLKRREGEISQGKIPGIYFDRIKFDELAKDLLLDYKINQKKSLPRVERSIKNLKEFFGGFKGTEITSPMIQQYIERKLKCFCRRCNKAFDQGSICPFCGSEKVKKGAENATINRELSALKRALNLGARQTPPKVDRVPFIPMLKERNVRQGFLEHNEYVDLKEALPDYLKPIITFGYKSGWRLSEVLGLTWERVDLKNGIVRMEPGETKNDEGRTFYLDSELKDIFRSLFRERRLDRQNVFIRDGEPIKGFRKAWLTACKKAKLKGTLFHDLRRTAIRNMVRAGIPEGVAMKISGHKTRSVFERYNIVSDRDLKLATKKQEAYFSEQEKEATGTVTGTIVDINEKRVNHCHG